MHAYFYAILKIYACIYIYILKKHPAHNKKTDSALLYLLCYSIVIKEK